MPRKATAVSSLSLSPESTLAKGLLGKKDETIKEMFAEGLHWGHRTSRWHPHIKPFLHGTHRNVHVFDLNKTYDYLLVALEYLREVSSQGKTILFVGTRGTEKELIKSLCLELNFPGVWDEWVGGTFTNFKEMAKRIKYFNDMESKQASGELEKYTKKERHEFAKVYAKMRKKWEGLKALEKLPDIVFLSNISENALTLKEARRMHIPVIAITDSNTDPMLVDYPIPGNDDAITSITFILAKVKGAILAGRGLKEDAADISLSERRASQSS